MIFFDKKICFICNANFDNSKDKKIADGYLCKNCCEKLSPWFVVTKETTQNQIRLQLLWREESKKLLSTFCKTKSITIGNKEILLLDDQDGSLIILRSGQALDNNPDVFNIREIKDAEFIVEEYLKTIDVIEDKDPYKERHYNYSYNFKINLLLKNPFIHNITFNLIDNRIDGGADDMEFPGMLQGTKVESFNKWKENNLNTHDYDGRGGYGIKDLTTMKNEDIDKFDECINKGSETIRLLTNTIKEPTLIRIKEV